MNERIDRLDFIKMKIFCSVKDKENEKTNHILQENTFKRHKW